MTGATIKAFWLLFVFIVTSNGHGGAWDSKENDRSSSLFEYDADDSALRRVPKNQNSQLVILSPVSERHGAPMQSDLNINPQLGLPATCNNYGEMFSFTLEDNCFICGCFIDNNYALYPNCTTCNSCAELGQAAPRPEPEREPYQLGPAKARTNQYPVAPSQFPVAPSQFPVAPIQLPVGRNQYPVKPKHFPIAPTQYQPTPSFTLHPARRTDHRAPDVPAYTNSVASEQQPCIPLGELELPIRYRHSSYMPGQPASYMPGQPASYMPGQPASFIAKWSPHSIGFPNPQAQVHSLPVSSRHNQLGVSYLPETKGKQFGAQFLSSAQAPIPLGSSIQQRILGGSPRSLATRLLEKTRTAEPSDEVSSRIDDQATDSGNRFREGLILKPSSPAAGAGQNTQPRIVLKQVPGIQLLKASRTPSEAAPESPILPLAQTSESK